MPSTNDIIQAERRKLSKELNTLSEWLKTESQVNPPDFNILKVAEEILEIAKRLHETLDHPEYIKKYRNEP